MLDADTERAARAFLGRIAGRYDIAGAAVYGSRARGDHGPDGDADLAVLLRGPKGTRMPDVWQLGGIAFDVMMDTGVLVQAMPIWLEDWNIPRSSAIRSCFATSSAKDSRCGPS